MDSHELRDATSVLAQLGGWIDAYTSQVPHSALGIRRPVDYRAMTSASSELTPPSNWRADQRELRERGADVKALLAENTVQARQMPRRLLAGDCPAS